MGASTVCDFCSTGFSCTRLSAALAILEAHPERMEMNPRLAQLVAETKSLLAAAKWDFHGGGRACALMGRTAEVRRMTDALIKAMNETRSPGIQVMPPEISVCERSYFQEEISSHD